MKTTYFKQALATFALLLVATAAHAYDVKINGIYYNLVPKLKQATVTYPGENPNNVYSNSYTGAIIIPPTVTNVNDGVTYTVTAIGDCAFCYSSITSIEIPNTITKIGNNAFQESQLQSITIPNTVKEIGERAFSLCNSLISATIQGNMDSWGEFMFWNCSQLSTVNLPYGMTEIPGSMFEYCTSLSSIQLPNTITSIKGCAFEGCSSLSSINLPKSCSQIYEGAFCECSSLSSINLENVSAIDYYAFQKCTSLTDITCPGNNISYGAFDGCTSLKTITLTSKNDITIGSQAFANCNKLDDVYCYYEGGGYYADEDGDGMDEYHIGFGLITPDDAFEGSLIEYAKLHVPSSVISEYQSRTPWKNFGTIKTMGEDHEYVDLGLPSGLMWATMNVGAASPEEKGGSYAWGETTTKDEYTIDTYKYATSLYEMTKYNQTDGLKTLESTDDAATVNWGADWRTPTLDEWNELNSKCTRIWTSVNGTNGYRFTGPNGNSIFLPVISDDNIAGYYWSSTLSDDYVIAAYNVDFDRGGLYIDRHDPTGADHRCNARAIRPVYQKAVPATMDLVDGNDYTNNMDLDLQTLTYTRTFNDTQWQPLYVPFSMFYPDWSADFDVASINDIHQYDFDNDGIIDDNLLEVIHVKSGSIEPHTPYLIRAKSTGTKTITLSNTKVYGAKTQHYDVSSWRTLFTFEGTYTSVSSAVMQGNSYFDLENGILKPADSSLGSYRWYLNITSRDGKAHNIKSIGIVDDPLATDVANVKTQNLKQEIYDLSGRRVSIPKKGLYIANGKKMMVK